MNVAIVDDVSADRVQLINDIKKYAKESTLLVRITEYTSGEEFLEKVNFFTLDAVFLDIYMDELNGMEVAQKIREHNSLCQIIFVTWSSDFAVQSYDVRAFHYILKPYDYKSIANVIGMLDKSLKKSSRFIKVKDGREWCKIFLSDIIYVDYNNHYVQIHTESSVISTYMKFQEIQDRLSPYTEFLNCYRCILVNMDKIQKLDQLFFLMTNGEYIPINRKQAKAIKSHYIDYIFEILEENDSGKTEDTEQSSRSQPCS